MFDVILPKNQDDIVSNEEERDITRFQISRIHIPFRCLLPQILKYLLWVEKKITAKS